MDLYTVVYVPPKYQKLTASAIARFDDEVYNPLYERIVDDPYKTYPRVQPLFPSYLFTRLGIAVLKNHLSSLRDPRFDHVRRVGEVAPEEIAAIKEREDERGYVMVSRDVAEPDAVRPGDEVMINTGAFYGCTGVVERITDANLPASRRIEIMINRLENRLKMRVIVPRGAAHRVKCA
jgi:transcription antitermination factor NusG